MTLGDVIQVVATLGAVLAAYIKIRERLTRIETQVEPMWRQFERRRAAHAAKEPDP